MIVSALLNLVKAVLLPLFGFLPDGTGITAMFQTTGPWAMAVGFAMGKWNSIVPVTEILVLALTIATYIVPAIIAYKFANWVYRHMPTIGGFGPGSG